MKILKKYYLFLWISAAILLTPSLFAAAEAAQAEIIPVMAMNATIQSISTTTSIFPDQNTDKMYDGTRNLIYQAGSKKEKTGDFTCTLDQTYTIRAIRVYDFNSYQNTYTVYHGETTEACSTAVDFTRTTDDTTYAGSGVGDDKANKSRVDELKFDAPVTSRYFKIHIEETGTEKLQINEIVFVCDDGNLLSGAELSTANEDVKYPLKSLFDGDKLTIFTPSTAGESTELYIDLKTEETFNLLESYDAAASGYASKYEIYAGQMVGESIVYASEPAAVIEPTAQRYNESFKPITARYVKIKVTGLGSLRGLGLYRLDDDVRKAMAVKIEEADSTVSVTVNGRYTEGSDVVTIYASYKENELQKTDIKEKVGKNEQATYSFAALDSGATASIFYLESLSTIRPVFANNYINY